LQHLIEVRWVGQWRWWTDGHRDGVYLSLSILSHLHHQPSVPLTWAIDRLLSTSQTSRHGYRWK